MIVENKRVMSLLDTCEAKALEQSAKCGCERLYKDHARLDFENRELKASLKKA